MSNAIAIFNETKKEIFSISSSQYYLQNSMHDAVLLITQYGNNPAWREQVARGQNWSINNLYNSSYCYKFEVYPKTAQRFHTDIANTVEWMQSVDKVLADENK